MSNKGKHLSEEHKNKLKENARINSNSGMKGKHHSVETKKKMSELAKGKHHSVETRKKLSEFFKGKPTWNKGKTGVYSEETRKKMSESRKKIMSNPEARKKVSEFFRGKTPWMKGKHFSEESKRKLSESHKGKPAWNIGIPCTWVAGEKNHLWKGGITPINEKIRKSLMTRNWRRAVFERDNWICQVCKKRGGRLHAHHIKPFSLFPELRFEVSNGITLCKECHKKTETYGSKSKKLI